MQELIAQEDIKAIKFLGVISNGTILMSPCMLYGYKVNKPMPSIILIPEIAEHSNICINKGYHSYAYPEKIILTNDNDITKVYYELIFESSRLSIELPKYPFTPLSYSPYECVIPKGTKYYINESSEIVSEKIIIKTSVAYSIFA